MTIDELKQLASKATPGPWEVQRTRSGHLSNYCRSLVEPPNLEWSDEDMDLIAAMRNNIDALIAVAEALKAIDDQAWPLNGGDYIVGYIEIQAARAALAKLKGKVQS